MQIKNIQIQGKTALAPMAGFTDRAFREICKDFGAAYTVTEMISAKALVLQSQKTKELIDITDCQRPIAIQLFGDEPKIMAKAAEICLAYNPDIIDINMGCPTPKIVGNKAGAALLKNPKLAQDIVLEVARACPLPVTVKLRTGWDAASITAVEVAKRCEAAGAAAITVHGRTREQMYHPGVDFEIIKEVKNAVQIPVIGNGDIFTPLGAEKMIRETGCDLVMCGRGALGKPWLFAQIESYLKDGTILHEPPLEERLSIMLRHIKLLCLYKGERIGMREARSHAAFYIKGIHRAAQFREKCGRLTTYRDLEELTQLILNQTQE